MREQQTKRFAVKNNNFLEHGKCMKASCLIPCELKKESCLIPCGVRPETANSTHPKLPVFKQKNKQKVG